MSDTDPVRTPYGESSCADDWLLRDAIFDRVGEVYTDGLVAIVRDWLGTYERAGCSLGDAQAELELEYDT